MPFNSKSNKASSPLVKIQDVPDVPTIGTAVEGAEEALVAFTPANTGGKAYQYRALSTPDGIEAVGTASPLLVSGLTAGTSYTFQVRGESNTGASTGYSSASNAVVPTVAGDYELIESNILTSSASSVTFSSIPQDYKHLQIRMTGRTDGGSTLYMRFNSDSGSNYARHALFANGSSVSSSGGSSQTYMRPLFPIANSGNDANIFGAAVIDILDFASSSKNTTIRSLGGNMQAAGFNSGLALNSGVWLNTSAVTSAVLLPDSGNFIAGSRFSLYGIRG